MVRKLRLGTTSQHFVSHLLLTFCLYIGAGYIGLTLTFAQENTSPFWPPTGIAICALLFFGYRVWPAIFAGVVAVNILATSIASFHLIPALLIATGNTLEAISAVWLIHYFNLASKPFSTIANTFKILFAITIPGSLISATIGVVTLTTFLGVPTEAFNYLWITWMTGNAMGALTIVPLVLSWQQSSLRPWNLLQTFELIILAAMAVTFSTLTFHDWMPKDYSNAMTFLVVLPVTWAAFRFGLRGATVLTLIVTLLATIGTVNGTGPYTNANINTALLLLQSFIATIAIISLSLAVLSEYQREHEASLFEHNQQLTSKVQQQHVAQETVENAFSKLHDENNFILSASTDGLVVINDAGKIVRTSAAFCRMLQYSDSVLHSQPLSAFLTTQQPFKLQPAIAKTNSEALTRHEVQMQAQSGKTVTVDVNMSRLVGQNKPYYYLYTHDITRKKKAEHTIKSLATRSSLVGQEAQFFYQCLTDAASFYGAKYAFIGLLTDKSPVTLQTFSGYANGECLEAFECNLQGTPCWDVISKASSILNTQVQISYPNIDMLQELGIVSYFGVPLFDRNKKLIGNVSIMDTKPLDIEPWEEQILQLLASRTSSELEHKQAMDEIESINTKLAWYSSHDSLTGLLNRQMFHLQLSSALSELERNNTPTHLLYCDVDEFHSINHTIGQPAGDYLLKQVAIRLKSQLDNKAVISRLGSDKFGIILTDTTLAEANHLAKRMTTVIEQSNFHWLGHDIHTSISIGIVPQSQLQNGAEAAILTAELACQTAKSKGKNQVATLPEVQNITPLERTNNG